MKTAIDDALDMFEKIVHDKSIDDKTAFRRFREAFKKAKLSGDKKIEGQFTDRHRERLFQIQVFIAWRRPVLASMMKEAFST